MKKIVFLFALVLSISTSTTIFAFDQTHDFEGFSIILDYYRTEDGAGYHIEKQGVEPFRITIEYPHSRLLFAGVEQIDNYLIYYGSIHKDGYPTYYDAYYLVTDLNGNIIHDFEYDFGDLEEIVGVYKLDGVYIFHTEQLTENIEAEFEFVANYFISFDNRFNILNETITYKEINSFKLTKNYFLFSETYSSSFQEGLRSDLSIIKDSDIPEILNNYEYEDSLYLDFINDAVLNGETIYNGYEVDYPGSYVFEYNNSVFYFTITTEVSGVEDNGVYTTPVFPSYRSGRAFLNNDLFVSGEEVYVPGNYVLSIEGANNYKEDYAFTITSNLSGILNNQTYVDEVEITFNGVGYLNNQHIESPYAITEEGEYILKITGENSYLEQYYFTVDYPERETSMIDFVQKYDLIILGVVATSSVIILKKK